MKFLSMNDNFIIMKVKLVTTLLILVLLWVVSKVAEIAVHEIRSFPAHNFHAKHLIIGKIPQKANQNIWMEISNYMYTMYLVYSFIIPFGDATMHTGMHNIICTWLMNNCNWGSRLSLTCQGFFHTCNAKQSLASFVLAFFTLSQSMIHRSQS
jgi:hypothetical protein